MDLINVSELASLREAWFDALQKYHDANAAYRALWADPTVEATPALNRERGIACSRASSWMFAEEEAFARLRAAAESVQPERN